MIDSKTVRATLVQHSRIINKQNVAIYNLTNLVLNLQDALITLKNEIKELKQDD